MELETVLSEIESCINSRPLTYVSDDVDSIDVLTPSHFLLGRHDSHRRIEVPGSEHSNMSGSLAREAFLLVGKRLEKFWDVWNKDYIRNLPNIRVSSKHCPIEIGSLVLVSEDNCPRLAWPLARVIRLLPGRDGVIRTVELKTTRGVVVRPVQRVHVLELENDPLPVGEEGSVPIQPPVICQNDQKTQCGRSTGKQVITAKGRVIKQVARLDL